MRHKYSFAIDGYTIFYHFIIYIAITIFSGLLRIFVRTPLHAVSNSNSCVGDRHAWEDSNCEFLNVNIDTFVRSTSI